MASSTSLFALLLLLFHVQHSSSFSLSVEKLEEDVIVSPNRTFTAGFYPAGENAYYFAIWFTQPHDQNTTITVVWIANRDQPVNGKRSTLSLLKTGNLILTDAGQSIVWSTDTNSNFPLEMRLQETGNLVLRNQNNKSSVLWQSFDFPTESEFHAEVNFIGRLNHMNLIGMWGYCAEGKHRILVYEYMEKGSLAENLSSSNALDWGKRYNIALGTARGLAYLHEMLGVDFAL
uniref:Bulb-type lectin domain-containing protein n=1 Tax=Lotus japonicus TaxID=34305 RepID=I3SDF7_LOTJA|nr:unknown [Lotus japonicus]